MGIKSLFKGGKSKESVICSPFNGQALPLSEVPDEVFAQEMVGKGVAFEPSEGICVSPINGTVVSVFDTKHAVGLKTDDGIEVLIHIGLETVNLKGEHFNPRVSNGDKISVGDVLMEFDLNALKEKGYKTITPMVISNTTDFAEVNTIKTGSINQKDEILSVKKQ